jgi:hypothetical protein
VPAFDDGGGRVVSAAVPSRPVHVPPGFYSVQHNALILAKHVNVMCSMCDGRRVGASRRHMLRCH